RADRHYHPAKQLAFWSHLSRPAGAGSGLSPFSSLFAWTRVAYIGVLSHADPGHPIFGFLSAARLRSIGSVCATRTVASGRSLHLRAISADAFLPRFSTGEYVPRRSGILY